MGTTINGYELLQAIGLHPEIFFSISADVKKNATALLKKYLKTNKQGVAGFRQARAAVSEEIFDLVLEELTDKEVCDLAKRLDPHFPGLTSSKPMALLRHIRALGASAAEPAPKPSLKSPAPAKRKTKTASKAKKTPFWPESMAAKPSRSRTKPDPAA